MQRKGRRTDQNMKMEEESGGKHLNVNGKKKENNQKETGREYQYADRTDV